MKVYELMNILSRCEAGADVTFYTNHAGVDLNMAMNEGIDNDEGSLTIFLNVIE